MQTGVDTVQEKLVSKSISDLNQRAELKQKESKLDTVPRQPFQMNKKQKRNSNYYLILLLTMQHQQIKAAHNFEHSVQILYIIRYFHARSFVFTTILPESAFKSPFHDT